MSANIIISNPPDYDLQGLAETTRQSLVLLKPWTLLDTSNDPIAAQIVAQAGKYVSAIQLGVSAAYSGFTVTEEVLFLANALPIEDKEDLEHYLVGMMDLAREARENANKAHKAFRNVRQEIFATMNDLKDQANAYKEQNTDSESFHIFPEHALDDIDVLVKFSEHISSFANWWDWVKVETDPSPSKGQPISFQLDTLREPGATKRWNHLRTQYTTYVQMISEMEDADPLFFSRPVSPDNSRTAEINATVGPSEGPLLITAANAPHVTPNDPLNLEASAKSVSITTPFKTSSKTSKEGKEKHPLSNERTENHKRRLSVMFSDSVAKYHGKLATHMRAKLANRPHKLSLHNFFKAGWTARMMNKIKHKGRPGSQVGSPVVSDTLTTEPGRL